MKYKLRATRYFYGPIKTKNIMQDDCYGDLILPSRRAAIEWIESADKDVYHLAHNESSRPTFALVPIK